MKHKRDLYWAERAMSPEHGYTPVDESGRVFGHVVCLPEAREKVCHKRRSDYVRESTEAGKHLPIWC